MKKIILSFFAVAIVATVSIAQGKAKPMKTQEERAERQVERMDKDLTLTAEQKTKIKEIMVKRDQAREDLINKYPEKNDAFKEENRKLNYESDKEIKAVLTKEQIEKQKQLREEAKEKRNKGNENPPAPPAPNNDKPAPPPPPAPKN